MDEPVRRAFPFNLLHAITGRFRPRPSVDLASEVLRAQVAIVREAFEKADLEVANGPAEGTRPTRDDADVAYLYRPGHALLRREDFERVKDWIGREENQKRYRGEVEGVETSVPELFSAVLPARVDERDPVLATLEELEREGVVEPGAVTPDHVVYVTVKGYLCPATEPEVPTERRVAAVAWPPPAPSPTGRTTKSRQVRVSVVDTGLWPAAASHPRTPWLKGVLADPSDEEVVDPNKIHPYAGHGTFVAGVIRCIAPGTRVEVEGVLTHGGAVYESEIVEQLHEAINEDDHPQLISISAGTHTRGDFQSIAFEMLGIANRLSERDDVLIVAAAGNDASTKPFWPAAFPWVVSVGSVDPTGAVSDFSNTGPWVDVYARGRDLVNAFPKGRYECHEPPNVGQVRTFDGLARWSGTSFATPIVTGLLAEQLRTNGGSTTKAWAAVRSAGTSAVDQHAGAITRVGPLT